MTINLDSVPAPTQPCSSANEYTDAEVEAQIALILEDFKVAYRLLELGQLAQYSGQFVAVLNGQLVGVGPDSVDLRLKVGQEQRAHPNRIAIIHIFDEMVV